MSNLAVVSPERAALAAEGLGASEVPTALGLNPFKHAAELAAEKRGEVPPFAGNRFTHWGKRLEAVVADEFLDRRQAAGEEVELVGPPTIRHPLCRRLFASLDRAVVPRGRRSIGTDIAIANAVGALEIKTAGRENDEWGEGATEFPDRYYIQVQVQLEVTEIERAWLAALIGGNDYREYPVTRDRRLGSELVEFANKWWSDHVVQGLPIQVDGSEAASSYIKRRFSKERSGLLKPTPEVALLVASLRDAKKALKDAEELEATLGNALRQQIGDAAGVEGFCTFKANKDSHPIDYEAALKSLSLDPQVLSALLAKFTTTTPGARVLRLAKEK